MEQKLISVIVPVYKVEKYLNKCVETILNQTYKNLEIILVDDGSPDKCPEICDSWAKKDSRIVVIHKENGGLSDARNAGIKVAKGEYISFIDSDDWIEADFYATLAKQLDDGADIAECATRLCDENDKTILIRGFESDTVMHKIEALQTLISEKGIMQTVWNKLYKKECIANIPFRFEKYHEDNFWTWKVFLNAEKIFVSNKPLYNYLQRNSGIMGSNYSLKRLDSLEANYELFAALKNDCNYRDLVCRKLITTCMYNMQCSINYLSKNEKRIAKNRIMKYIKDSKIKSNDKALNSIWQKLFIISPVLISKIRNLAGIGF